jgi:hypothetical protein
MRHAVCEARRSSSKTSKRLQDCSCNLESFPCHVVSDPSRKVHDDNLLERTKQRFPFVLCKQQLLHLDLRNVFLPLLCFGVTEPIQGIQPIVNRRDAMIDLVLVL